jgi:hypothetical protein
MKNASLNGSKAHIVNFRIRAPHTASGDRKLELARQVIKLGIARQHPVRLESEGRGVANLICIHSSNRAAGNVAGDIAAGAGGIQANSPKLFEDVGESLDRHPVQLNVLPHRKIGGTASVEASKLGDGS